MFTVFLKNDLLALVPHRDGLECDACDRFYRDGYICRKLKFNVHMRCAFVFQMENTLKHPSHDGHCVELLVTGAPDNTDPKCHLCGKNTKRLLYHCSVCKLNLDIDCMLDGLCAQSNLNMLWHSHPLLEVALDEYTPCEICGRGFLRGYFCARCRLLVHKGCVVSILESTEITNPCHARHSLKLLMNGAPSYTDQKCHLCGEQTGNLLYHCDICKFNLDLKCANSNTPPVVLPNLKVHEHTLTLMPRLISFLCDACGTKGDRAPYACHQCDFMIHQNCAHLPRVIHVNHHDHRVSYTYPLGLGVKNCGVCLEEIDWSCGAYSCSLCPNYALHSRCATRDDVWDKKELDGVPEETEYIKPFIINDDNTITHFAHEHKMSLNDDGIAALEESISCKACFGLIGSNTFYSCSNCDFILHQTCAILPTKKRHFLSPRPLTLQHSMYTKKCRACQQRCCGGFMYISKNESFDLLCSSITVPFIHECHPHPLLYLGEYKYGHLATCKSCGLDGIGAVLGCTKCNYFLDFRCATLPLSVKLHRYDDHPLTLCYGDEKANNKYWCDICERETNPETWFYTCKDCGVTLHVLCVLGDLRYGKQGGKVSNDVKLLPNNRSVRPVCKNCHCRCPGPFFLIKDDDIYFCSHYCLIHFLSKKSEPGLSGICPPWAHEHT